MNLNDHNSIKNTLLVVGTPGGKYSLSAILDALLLLKNTGLRLNLHCVAHVDEAVRNILDTSDSYFQIKEQVSFENFKQLPDAYKNTQNCFAGLVLPSALESPADYLQKLYINMAVGLPVICADLPLNRHLIDKCHCGICVNPDNAEELADAISYLKQAGYQATKMGECGKKAVSENLGWKQEIESLFITDKNSIS